MSEYRPGGFQILPPVIKNLLIINVLVFAATYVLQKAGIINLKFYLGLFHWKSPLFEPWQIVTHMFMHGDLTHLFFNMFALWMFGNVIENTLGTKRFIIFYLICGLGAAACHMAVFSFEHSAAIAEFSTYSSEVQFEEVNKVLTTGGMQAALPMAVPMLGASGAIYGLLFAFGYLFPNLMIYVYFLFPIKAKYFVAIFTVLELIEGFRNNPADNVAHFAHLGGMLFAFLLLKAWKFSAKNIYRY